MTSFLSCGDMKKRNILKSLVLTATASVVLLSASCATIAGMGQDVSHLGEGIHKTAVKSSQPGAWGSKPTPNPAVGEDPYLSAQ